MLKSLPSRGQSMGAESGRRIRIYFLAPRSLKALLASYYLVFVVRVGDCFLTGHTHSITKKRELRNVNNLIDRGAFGGFYFAGIAFILA